MSIPRTFFVVVVAMLAHAHESRLRAQSRDVSETPVTLVVSTRLLSQQPNTALRIAVRDADAPDQPIDYAYTRISELDSGSANRPPRALSANDRGLVAAKWIWAPASTTFEC